MSTILWPVDLPDLTILQGFKETLPKLVIRTPMDAGPAKRRRRFTTNVTPISLTMALTIAEYEIFTDFFVNTTAGGALSFDWVHPVTGSPITFAFADEPDISADGPQTLRVTMKLEIQP